MTQNRPISNLTNSFVVPLSKEALSFLHPSILSVEGHVDPELLRKTSLSEANREIVQVERERAQMSNDTF